MIRIIHSRRDEVCASIASHDWSTNATLLRDLCGSAVNLKILIVALINETGED
jgi:hypothetical protein